MRLFPTLAALIALTIPAFAGEITEDTAQTIRTERHFCTNVCARRLKGCMITHSAPEARCDAAYIGCESGCAACLPKFESCAEAGPAPEKCHAPLMACLKEASASGKTDEAAVHFEGGDGSSQKTAVVVVAKTEQEGILAEDLWVLKTHDTWHKKDQALVHDGGRSFDTIGYETPEGDRQLWFDITSFFGKM